MITNQYPYYCGVPSLQASYVNGIIGAKAYNIPPNSTFFLIDSDAPFFYVKTSDRNGMCTLKTYEFKEVVEETNPTSQFITRAEFEAKLAALQAATSSGKTTTGLL